MRKRWVLGLLAMMMLVSDAARGQKEGAQGKPESGATPSVAEQFDAGRAYCPNGAEGAFQQPMTFEVGGEDERPRIMLAIGKVVATTPAALRAKLEEVGWVDELHLHSPGGDAIAGLELGRVIRQYGLATHIPTGATCFSACSYAFLGGLIRSISLGACYGVHMFTAEVDRDNIESMLGRIDDLSEGSAAEDRGALIDLIQKIVLANQQRAARLARARARYLTEMSVSLRLMIPAFETQASDAYWLKYDELRKYNVRNVQ